MKELKKAQMGMIAVLAVMLVSIKRRLPVTRKLSSGITTLTLAGIVLLVAAGSASANTIDTCNFNANVAGYYVLGQDLICNADDTGITIGADGVTIDGYNATDGQCYTITGAVTGSDCGISVTSGEFTGEGQPASHAAVVNKGNHNIVLKNLTIKKFCTGISLKNTENTTVTGCDIYDNGKSGEITHGVHMAGVWNSAITRNAIHNNTGSVCGCGGGGNGIFTFGGDSPAYLGDYNKITCNNLYDNEKAGFFSKKKCAYNTISYNNVTGNRAGGIILRCAATHNTIVEYNNASNNLGTGIYFRANNNTLRYNTVVNNKDGSPWGGATACSPILTICDYGVGVEVEAGGTNAKIYNNTICNNDHVDVEDNSNGGGGGFLVGDYNTGGSVDGYIGDASAGGSSFVYDCTDLVSVYYDYDGDDFYSNETANCGCGGCSAGACCNPGLFSDTGKAQHCAGGICKPGDGPGTDPCDCDFDIKGDARPDLVIQDLNVTWLNGGANETHYEVRYKVCNIGGGDSVASVARITIDDDAKLAHDQNIGELVKNTCTTIITVGPFEMDPDSDTIEVCADANNDNLNEISELNNCSSVTQGARKPDLIITAKYETWDVKPNYWINYTVCNIGNATAPASETRRAIDGAHSPAGSVPSIAPGACTGDMRVSGAAIAMSADGIDNITLFADGNNSKQGVIDEWNETNNSITNVWKLTLDAEIGIDQPDNVDPQSQFTINITVDPMLNEISAVQYDLYYNTSVVWAEWANPGSFLNRSGISTDVTVLKIDNLWDVAGHKGKITYAETTLGSGGTLPSVNAEGILTTIQFSAIGVRGAYSVMDIEDVLISDPLKNDVPVDIADCGVTIYDNQDPVAIGESMYRFSNVASKFQCFAVLCPCLSNGGNDLAGWGENIAYVRWDFGDGQYGTSEGVDPCEVKEHMYTTWNWIGGNEPGPKDGSGYEPFEAYLTVRDDGVPQLSDTTSVFVQVYIAGDANGDGVVDIFDAACVGKHWGQPAENPAGTDCTPYWTTEQADEADLNNDMDVDTIDAMIVGTNWNHAAWPPYYIE
ncbi:MAG: right-handed parallel beta-helix repeat-containing protein [Methanosarcinales archaeon]|nr:right-handed parallel beta-helix repeat-containing protein [Methanosarcinales archaeon]